MRTIRFEFLALAGFASTGCRDACRGAGCRRFRQRRGSPLNRKRPHCGQEATVELDPRSPGTT